MVLFTKSALEFYHILCKSPPKDRSSKSCSNLSRSLNSTIMLPSEELDALCMASDYLASKVGPSTTSNPCCSTFLQQPDCPVEDQTVQPQGPDFPRVQRGDEFANSIWISLSRETLSRRIDPRIYHRIDRPPKTIQNDIEPEKGED
jgi:hypothetical protein